MFKQLVTLFRGKGHEAAEALVERNALVILDQQLREAAAAIAVRVLRRRRWLGSCHTGAKRSKSFLLLFFKKVALFLPNENRLR